MCAQELRYLLGCPESDKASILSRVAQQLTKSNAAAGGTVADGASDSSTDIGGDHSGGDNDVGEPGSGGIGDSAGSVGNNGNSGTAARAGPGADSEEADSNSTVRSPTGMRSEHVEQQEDQQQQHQQEQLRQVPQMLDGKQSLAIMLSKVCS